MFRALKSDKVGSYLFILITVYNHFIKALLFLSFLPQTMPVIYWSDRGVNFWKMDLNYFN
jgi:hypothetical protein